MHHPCVPPETVGAASHTPARELEPPPGRTDGANWPEGLFSTIKSAWKSRHSSPALEYLVARGNGVRRCAILRHIASGLLPWSEQVGLLPRRPIPRPVATPVQMEGLAPARESCFVSGNDVELGFESDDLQKNLALVRASRRQLIEQLSEEISALQRDPQLIDPERLSLLVAELQWITSLMRRMESMQQALAQSERRDGVLLQFEQLNPTQGERKG